MSLCECLRSLIALLLKRWGSKKAQQNWVQMERKKYRKIGLRAIGVAARVCAEKRGNNRFVETLFKPSRGLCLQVYKNRDPVS